MSIKTRKLLLLILLLAVFVRLLHFNAIRHTAFIDFPLHATETDMYGYWAWSDSIISGDWLGKNTYHPRTDWMKALGDTETWYRWWGDSRVFHQEPVYPYLLALGKLSGLAVGGFILAQLLLGSLQSLVTFWLSRMIFRQDEPALFSALIAGIYGPLIFNQGVLLRDWTGPLLGSLVLATFLYAHEKNKIRYWFLPGIVLGFTLMTYSTIMAFLLTLIPWLVWVSRDSIICLFKRVIIVLGGLLVGFSPLLARNLLVGAMPFSITNRLPFGIVAGMAADVSPVGMSLTQSVPTILEKSQGSAWIAAKESIKTYHGDWIALLQLLWLKFRGLMDPFEIPNNLSYIYGQEISPILKIMPDYGWLLPLGVIGVLIVIFSKRFDERHWLLFAFGVAIFVALMINQVIGRYRLIITVFLFVYAGWTIWQIWHWITLRQTKRLAIACSSLLVVFLIQHIIVPVKLVRQSTFMMFHPTSYEYSSLIYIKTGHPDRAISEWNRLRLLAEKSGNIKLADTAINNELSLREKLVFYFTKSGREDLVNQNLYDIERLFDNKTDKSLHDFVLGKIYFKLGRLKKAQILLQRFIDHFPDRDESKDARRMLTKINRQTNHKIHS